MRNEWLQLRQVGGALSIMYQTLVVKMLLSHIMVCLHCSPTNTHSMSHLLDLTRPWLLLAWPPGFHIGGAAAHKTEWVKDERNIVNKQTTGRTSC